MGDQQDPDPELGPQLVEQVEDLLLDGDVEGAGGLVGDQEPRAGQDRERDQHPLQLPAGELMGEGVEDPSRLGQAHPLERRVHERLALLAAMGAGHERRRLEGLGPDRAHRVQGGARVLRHEAQHPPAQRQELPLAQARHLAALDPDRPVHAGAAGAEQAQHGPRDRGLARAGLADQGEGTARADGEGDPVTTSAGP